MCFCIILNCITAESPTIHHPDEFFVIALLKTEIVEMFA